MMMDSQWSRRATAADIEVAQRTHVHEKGQDSYVGALTLTPYSYSLKIDDKYVLTPSDPIRFDSQHQINGYWYYCIGN